ncbi:MAG: hypothetical protein ACLP7W_00530 [Solirubrobacteraceae bacterium]
MVSVRSSRVGALALAGLLALIGALALAGALPGPGATIRASAQSPQPETTPQTDASVPATNVTMIGATPNEPGAPGPNETWGVGAEKSGAGTEEKTIAVIVRYAGGSGWSLVQRLDEGSLAGFKFESSPLAGQMTPHGDGVLAGALPKEGGGSQQAILVRKQGGAFEATPAVTVESETPQPGEEPLLHKGETLFGAKRAPLIAPLEEESGEAGALVAPIREGSGVEDQVLHYDGHEWTSEPIEIPTASKEEFRVLGIGATSPTNAWLLAQLSSKASYPAGAVALFRRVHEGEGEHAKWVWKPVTATGKGEEAEPLTVPVQGGGAPEPFTLAGLGEPPTVVSQVLTVTSEGLWIDGQRGDVHTRTPASTTIFFRPEGEASEIRGHVEASWCLLPAAASGAPQCQYELPEALPGGYDRSIAWSGSEAGGRFGARVITGLAEGVSLRLEGESFTRVLALGAGSSESQFPGAQLGAAFSAPREGWLGADGMPVHLTTEPAASRLKPWPAPFRHPLFAVAPQPGVPVGALSSEAVAVGDQGAVARFKPGAGWLPESLFGPGEQVEHPRLRAVAWPTPNRIFAVGDHGQMWLWRGETDLWEKDPATPLNFRGNLLGVAFDPEEPSYGFAVGSSTVGSEPGSSETGEPGPLLRYGKTWTQQAFPAQKPCSPKEAAGNSEEVKREEVERCASWAKVSFTSVTFAGSEAIVVYRLRGNISQSIHATGGLLVKEGKESAWHVDEGAAAAMGNGVPVSVAGSPDGGAAFTTVGGSDGPQVIERASASSSWEASPTPLPGSTAGQIAVFREGSTLRAIVSAGGISNESEPQKPAEGFPPSYLEPFPPIAGGQESGGILRQTASGWSDETHELNPAGEPQGGYTYHDLPYRLDPILAVLVSPDGGEGWAVGGQVNTDEKLETGDLERYPNEGATPLGEGTAPVAPEVPAHNGVGERRDVTFAIGGGAQCSAPCAARADAKIGPDVWLKEALRQAANTGARAFLYTGPRVTTAETQGPKTQAIPFAQEFERYAQILGSSPLPIYAAISPYELNARPESDGSEGTFQAAFAGFPQAGLSAPDGGEQGCSGTVGCQTAYYAFEQPGEAGTVRVIVLDDSSDVDSVQLDWLAGELASAKTSHQPAIVVGDADLNAQIQNGDTAATAVAQVLAGGDASAYFYDAPEENVQRPLLGTQVPSFGSGTLGYVNIANERFGDFHGASGFMLAQVEFATYDPATNIARVSARLIPDIGELALEAVDGILLRRSEPGFFDALARRPRAGGRAVNSSQETEVDPYIPIPEECVGTECAVGMFPEYAFSSSDKEVGQFVVHNRAAANNPLAVLQNAKGEAIPDEPVGEVDGEPVNEKHEAIPREQSGLFCPYFQGTTTVTIEAGGLKSSLPVTVQAGSVREPCGTVPQKHLAAAAASASAPAPPPAPAPAPVGPSPAGAPPVVPVPPPPPVVAAPVPPARPIPAPPPFFLPPAPIAPLLAFVPPPVPTPARPTPPSGTSAVTSPVEMAEHEEEEESATESVSNQALAYRAPEHEPSPVYVLGIVLLAAFAGASTVRRRPRRGRRELRVAPATLSSMRAQRRMDPKRRL